LFFGYLPNPTNKKGVLKSEMMELDVVARRWSSTEVIFRKVGDCFALSGSQRHGNNSSLGTPNKNLLSRTGDFLLFNLCKTHSVFGNDYKLIFQPISIIFKKFLKGLNFYNRPLIIKPKQDNAFVQFLVAENFIPKSLSFVISIQFSVKAFWMISSSSIPRDCSKTENTS